jgi:hypothetical protein
MSATVILSPIANRTFVTTTGAVYIADSNGLIVSTTITSQEVTDLKAAGCSVLTPPPTDLIGYIKSANFNATADQAVNLLINAKYRIRRITALNTSVNGMSTAVGGVYTAAAKGGSAIVANTQAYTGLTNALTALDLTLALPNLVLAAGTPLYLSLTTAQGAPATADIAVYGDTFTF